MAECHQCRTIIRGETGLMCEGTCKKVFHCTKKCSGLDQYSRGILESIGLIRYICDDCIHYMHNIDKALVDIQKNMEKNCNNLTEYKGEFEAALKQNENAMKNLLEAIENKYDERIKKLDEAQKVCQINVNEIKKIYGKINDQQDKNQEICNTIEKQTKTLQEEIKKTVIDTSVKTNKMSFSEIVKGKSMLPDESKQNPIIIKPKEKQTVNKTKEDLNKKVNPSNFKIVNIEQRRNGSIVIQSENNEEREKIKEVLQNEMSGSYEIKVPHQKEMKIKLTGMTFKFTEDEIIEKLKRQNEILSESEIEIIKLFEYKRNGQIIYNGILKIDKDSYIKVMDAQKLNIGWEKCRVFEGTDIIQCYKCMGYNHKSKECKFEEVCYKCHGNHKSKECTNSILNKCINCVRVNKRLNLGLEENHTSTNRECPVYQNKLNAKRRRSGLMA